MLPWPLPCWWGYLLSTLVWAFGRFMVSSTCWAGSSRHGLCTGASKVSEKSRAAGLALGVWFLFVLVFDLLPLALLVLSEGHFSATLLPLAAIAQSGRYLSADQPLRLRRGEGGWGCSLGSELPFLPTCLGSALLLWVGVSLWLAYAVFRRRSVWSRV